MRWLSGALVGIRTPNLLIRSQMLYPIELRVLGLLKNQTENVFLKRVAKVRKISLNVKKNIGESNCRDFLSLESI